MLAEFKTKKRGRIQSDGFVLHTLEAALWCVYNSNGFDEAVLSAANLGNDADTTAAVTGLLAGAIYGMSGIPFDWLKKLAWRKDIEARVNFLLG